MSSSRAVDRGKLHVSVAVGSAHPLTSTGHALSLRCQPTYFSPTVYTRAVYHFYVSKARHSSARETTDIGMCSTLCVAALDHEAAGGVLPASRVELTHPIRNQWWWCLVKLSEVDAYECSSAVMAD